MYENSRVTLLSSSVQLISIIAPENKLQPHHHLNFQQRNSTPTNAVPLRDLYVFPSRTSH